MNDDTSLIRSCDEMIRAQDRLIDAQAREIRAARVLIWWLGAALSAAVTALVIIGMLS